MTERERLARRPIERKRDGSRGDGEEVEAYFN
jgi:hypothetical protein